MLAFFEDLGFFFARYRLCSLHISSSGAQFEMHPRISLGVVAARKRRSLSK